MKVVYHLYMATDPEGRSYIGCTYHAPEHRWAGHYSKPPRAWPGDEAAHISDAIKRFGRGAFTLTHLATVFGSAEAAEIETLLIEQHGTMTPRGYNHRARGGGGLIFCGPGHAPSRQWPANDTAPHSEAA